jgi:hypothetical protein
MMTLIMSTLVKIIVVGLARACCCCCCCFFVCSFVCLLLLLLLLLLLPLPSLTATLESLENCELPLVHSPFPFSPPPRT